MYRYLLLVFLIFLSSCARIPNDLTTPTLPPVFTPETTIVITEVPFLNPTATSTLEPINEVPTWINLGGPRGGTGYDIKISPEDSNTLWVTDVLAGVNTSVDGGVTWAPMNNGIDSRMGLSGDDIPIFCLSIDPNDADTIWVGVQGGKAVFKTIDGGLTWTRKDKGIIQQPVMEFRGFAIHPQNSDILFTGGNYLADEVNGTQRGFIYRSMDGGESWTLVYEPDALVRWIIIDPSQPDTMYASTGIFDRTEISAQGVLKSSDGGETWMEINIGLDNLSINALAMHPTDHLTLLAGTGKAIDFASSPEDRFAGGVYLTHDGGMSWTKIDPFVAERDDGLIFTAVSFAPSNPNIIYADAGKLFLRSVDGGESWDIFKTGPNPQTGFFEHRGIPIAIVAHPKNPDVIYMNAYAGGVFLSEDGGRTWRDSSKGLSGAQTWSIAVDGLQPGYIVVGSKNGVHLSIDAGETFTGLITKDQIRNITAVAIDDQKIGHILIGTDGQAAIFYSTNGGLNWEEVLRPLQEGRGVESWRTINDIAFAPSNSSIVFAATGIGTFGVDPTRGTHGNGMFISTDGGQTWSAINNGLQETTLNIFKVVVHPENPQIAYIGTMDDGIYKTETGGENWYPVGADQPFFDVRALALNPSNPDQIIAGAFQQGLWRSLDGGMNWDQINGGIPLEAQLSSVVINPANPEEIFLSDLLSGVYRSYDGGSLWHPFNDELDTHAVRELVISEDGFHLYAATDGKGVYRFDLSDVVPESLDPAIFPRFSSIEEWDVNIDGDGSDWLNRVVVTMDQIGEVPDGLLDFTNSYAFMEDEALYFLIEVDDPNARVSQFKVHLQTESDKISITVCPWGTNGAILAGVGGENQRYVGETEYSHFGFYPSFEGKIDFRDLGSHEEVQLVFIEALEGKPCYEHGGRIADQLILENDIPSGVDSMLIK
ncbi:MAG: hypothetical protein JEZ06_13625 [Anaerolineaceae bacterium]|nr:hypothetical protein [Anaerolineaceae bacterium]